MKFSIFCCCLIYCLSAINLANCLEGEFDFLDPRNHVPAHELAEWDKTHVPSDRMFYYRTLSEQEEAEKAERSDLDRNDLDFKNLNVQDRDDEDEEEAQNGRPLPEFVHPTNNYPSSKIDESGPDYETDYEDIDDDDDFDDSAYLLALQSGNKSQVRRAESKLKMRNSRLGRNSLPTVQENFSRPETIDTSYGSELGQNDQDAQANNLDIFEEPEAENPRKFAANGQKEADESRANKFDERREVDLPRRSESIYGNHDIVDGDLSQIAGWKQSGEDEDVVNGGDGFYNEEGKLSQPEAVQPEAERFSEEPQAQGEVAQVDSEVAPVREEYEKIRLEAEARAEQEARERKAAKEEAEEREALRRQQEAAASVPVAPTGVPTTTTTTTTTTPAPAKKHGFKGFFSGIKSQFKKITHRN